MIVFQHHDNKFLNLKNALLSYRIKSDAIRYHPILAPIYLLKLIFQGKKIEVYVFRYLNDCDSYFLALLRCISEYLKIKLLKINGTEIWWLCHNVDKETSVHFNKLIQIRRSNVQKSSKYIFTTNELLIDIARKVFPDNFIDSISLGFIPNGALNISQDSMVEDDISEWINENSDRKTKVIFCIGSPAKKVLHFKFVTKLIDNLNNESKFKWLAIVIGSNVENNIYIYNVSYKLGLNPTFIQKHADYFYRVMNDYSMSYSIYEASYYKIPIITEDYGILPKIIKKYKIGVVVDINSNIENIINSYDFSLNGFERFNLDNNWNTAANKISFYYNKQKDI